MVSNDVARTESSATYDVARTESSAADVAMRMRLATRDAPHIRRVTMGMDCQAAPIRRAITDPARADCGYIYQALLSGCLTVPPSACGWDLIQLADEGRGEGHFKSTVQGQKNQYPPSRAAFALFVPTGCSPFFFLTLSIHMHAHQHSHARRTA